MCPCGFQHCHTCLPLPGLCAPPTAPASAVHSTPSAVPTLPSTSRRVTQAAPTSPERPTTATGFRSGWSLRSLASISKQLQLHPDHVSSLGGAALHPVQVCWWGPDPGSPRPLSQRLPPSAHTHPAGRLPGCSDRLHHSQPHVHDGAQVSAEPACTLVTHHRWKAPTTPTSTTQTPATQTPTIQKPTTRTPTRQTPKTPTTPTPTTVTEQVLFRT